MADTHETNHPGVTAADAVRDLFARLPQPGKDIVWLADELIGIVQHVGSVTVEVGLKAGGERSLVCHSPPSSPYLVISGAGPLYLFRPLLARLAVLGADETRGAFAPYGGQFVLTRSSRSGPVRLEIDFINTPARQQLVITRVPILSAPRTDLAPGTGATDTTSQATV